MIAQIFEKTRHHWKYRNAPVKAQKPDLDDYPVVTSEILRFADTDQNGHISNAVFSVFCQNARMSLLNDAARIAIPSGHMLPIVKMNIEFLAEVHWPGTVEIGTRFNYVGRSSIGLDQAIFDSKRCVAKARSTIVLIDRGTRRPAALPPLVIDQIRLLLSDEPEPVTRKIGFKWFVKAPHTGGK